MSVDGAAGSGALDARLRRVLQEALQVEELPGGEVRRNDVEAWDSISHLRLMLEIEQEFNVSLDDEEFVFVDSLGGIAELLRRRGVSG